MCFTYCVFMVATWSLLSTDCSTSPVENPVVKQLNNSCSFTEFPCDDGACVPWSSLCDGIGQCADSSDEVMCNEIPVGSSKRFKRQASSCKSNEWQCGDGSCIEGDWQCDERVDCPDSSDEADALCKRTGCIGSICAEGTAVNAGDTDSCANVRCSAGFHCVSGTCVIGSNDDKTAECVEGYEEFFESCQKGSSTTELSLSSSSSSPPPPPPSPSSGACELPSPPLHGSYTVAGIDNPKPGQRLEVVHLTVGCDKNYTVIGDSELFCVGGIWSKELPECTRFCYLNKHPSVEYFCEAGRNGDDRSDGLRECGEYEPSGTTVRPECKGPNYYSSGILNLMRCKDGTWDHIAVCKPECGKVTPGGDGLIINGRNAKRGELPWHAGIYRKYEEPYLQICSGSLITTTAVVSAAHCFWNDVTKLLPANKYAVAVGKLYRPWSDPKDVDAQKSDVSEIRVPQRFAGVAASYQDDIALVIVVTPFVYMTFVRPVCLDFNYNFDRRQLSEGNLGKVAGWGLTAANGSASQVLKVAELPYIDIQRCISESPPTFREYITSDKICAGYKDKISLCKGDSGGGLAFPESDRGIERYYLRGVVSTAPQDENVCNPHTYTAFTQVIRHEHFIKQYVWLET